MEHFFFNKNVSKNFKNEKRPSKENVSFLSFKKNLRPVDLMDPMRSKSIFKKTEMEHFFLQSKGFKGSFFLPVPSISN